MYGRQGYVRRTPDGKWEVIRWIGKQGEFLPHHQGPTNAGFDTVRFVFRANAREFLGQWKAGFEPGTENRQSGTGGE